MREDSTKRGTRRSLCEITVNVQNEGCWKHITAFSNVKMVLDDDDDEMTIKLLTALTIQQLNVQTSGSQFK